MNTLGSAYRHTVISISGNYGASCYVAPSTQVNYAPEIPKPAGPRVFARTLKALSPDLILTYNWGAIEACMGGLWATKAPVIHGEDGFGAEEAHKQKLRRVAIRAVVLRGVFRLIAPSKKLFQIMLRTWHIPERLVDYIPNGVDVELFAPGAPRHEETCVVGTVGQLRPEKCQAVLIRVCGSLAASHSVRLVLAGEGDQRPALEQLSASFGPKLNVTFAGHRPDVERVYPELDIFALTSSTEQMPLAILEAMACGLPIVSTNVGDVQTMVSEENRPFVVDTEEQLRGRLEELIANPELRRRLGAANRARAVEVYSLRTMMNRYDALFQAALSSKAQGATQ